MRGWRRVGRSWRPRRRRAPRRPRAPLSYRLPWLPARVCSVRSHSRARALVMHADLATNKYLSNVTTARILAPAQHGLPDAFERGTCREGGRTGGSTGGHCSRRGGGTRSRCVRMHCCQGGCGVRAAACGAAAGRTGGSAGRGAARTGRRARRGRGSGGRCRALGAPLPGRAWPPPQRESARSHTIQSFDAHSP